MSDSVMESEKEKYRQAFQNFIYKQEINDLIFPRICWFDDALLDQYEIAFPLLKKYNLKHGVILAVPTRYVGKTFPWTDPHVDLPMMNVSQIKEMMEYGVLIASHTVTHSCFKGMTRERLVWELTESKKWIETNLGVTPKILVVPFNDYSQEQKDIILEHYSYVRPAIFPPISGYYNLHHNFRDDKEKKLSKRWGEEFLKGIIPRFEDQIKMERSVRFSLGFYDWKYEFDKTKINIPEVSLPEGYRVCFAIPDKDGKLCEKDKQIWHSLHSNKMFAKIVHPENAEGVIFAYYKDEPIGCFVVNTYGDAVEFEHAIVSELHRKKGIYKAMIVLGLHYTMQKEKIKWIIAIPLKMLESFWNEIRG